MLYILSGQDDFSLTQSLEEIKRAIGEPAALAADITTFDGQQVTLAQLSAVCETVPFLLGRRLVIVRGLLERFEPGSRTSRQKKTRPNNLQEEYKSFGDRLKKIPESTILVLVENRLTNNNPLFKELAARAEVKYFPLLREARLRQWLQKRVAEEGGSISPPAVELLAKLIGSNLWAMAGEINKLVLFAAGRRIEEDDVRIVVSYDQQVSVFALVDAVIEFKAELAEQWLQQLLQRGATPTYLLTMLVRQIRMVTRTKGLTNEGKPRRVIQDRLGLSSEYALNKTLEQAGRYSLPRLKEVYHRLLEADLAIKTGKYGDELALNLLVAELCQHSKSSLAHARNNA